MGNVRGLVSVAIPVLQSFRDGFGREISRVDIPRIHQGFSRIGVDVRYVLHDFCLRTVSCSPAKQHDRRFGTREYLTGGDRFSKYFRTAGIRCRTTDKQRSL